MLHAILTQRAQSTPDRIAVIQGERRVAWGELELMTSRVASYLAQTGMGKGDRIGILSQNSPEYIAAYFGVQRAGGIAVDINYRDSIPEIRTIINHCSVSTLIMENAYTAEVGS